MSSPSESTGKGRAVTARPLLVLGLASAFLLAAPALAQATLLPPLLTESNPASPGASAMPRIRGQVEEEITKAVPFGTASFDGPITRDPEPNNTVRLYTDSNCSGPVAANGTVSGLEDTGLQVTVIAESTTTFYGIQENGEEASVCSPQGFSYRQVSSAPVAPSFTGASPASPANYNFPYLLGSADPEATISIYAGSGCSGSPVASGSGATFAAPGIQVSVTDNTETTFYAKATMAGFSSPCTTTPIVYREVTPPPAEQPGGGGGSTPVVNAPAATPPPAPRLRMVPGHVANDNSPIVTGTALEAGWVKVFAGAHCGAAALAKVPIAAFLASGVVVQVPDNSLSTLSATSLSLSGRESGCSEAVTYVEDSTAPHTRITMGPASKTAKRKAIFRFTDTTGDPAGTAFLCKVDAAKWKACSSPLTLRHLRPHRYTVEVKATDPAGNAEPKGAKRRFKVIRHP